MQLHRMEKNSCGFPKKKDILQIMGFTLDFFLFFFNIYHFKKEKKL